MMSTTVSAALVTSGLPANVDPWSPGFMLSATCCLTSTAPMGSPPAEPGSFHPICDVHPPRGLPITSAARGCNGFTADRAGHAM